MKHIHHYITCVAIMAAALFSSLTTARAGHVYAGLIETNGTGGLQAGDALSFINQTTGVAVTSLTTANSVLVTTAGPQQGLYLSTNPTFTALASTGTAFEGAAYIPANAFAADPNTFLILVLTGVTGPGGAHFSFWDSGATSATWTYTIGSGLTGSGTFALTNDGTTYAGQEVTIGDGVTTSPAPTTPNGNPAADPYGHIHGRSFTVDLPGAYTASYVIHDTTGIHPDSSAFLVNYNAVPEPSTFVLFGIAGLAGFVVMRCRLSIHQS